MIIKIKKDRRDNDKIKLIHDKRSPFGPYKMDKVERRNREIIDNCVCQYFYAKLLCHFTANISSKSSLSDLLYP